MKGMSTRVLVPYASDECPLHMYHLRAFALAANFCKPPILWKNNVLLAQKVGSE